MPEQDPCVRLRIDLAYDGAPFRGWARQPGLPSVQEAVEDALCLVFRVRCPTVVPGGPTRASTPGARPCTWTCPARHGNG